MTAFVIGQTVRSRTPEMPVDALEPGTWLFRLVVIDDDRVESAPAELRVRVLRRGEGPVVPTGPTRPIPIDVIVREPVRPIRPDPGPVIRPTRPLRPGGPQ